VRLPARGPARRYVAERCDTGRGCLPLDGPICSALMPVVRCHVGAVAPTYLFRHGSPWDDRNIASLVALAHASPIAAIVYGGLFALLARG
jgi:hypothetical protein